MIGIRSHYNAGSAAIAIESREERRALADILSELPPNTTVATIAAPSGELRDARNGKTVDSITGLANAYKWAASAPGRVLVVWDWHTLANNAGAWRALIEAIPALRSPKGAKTNDHASLCVFIGPAFELSNQNPLRGALPILPFSPPDRAAIAKTAESLHAIPTEIKESVIDSLCGLPADAAEQCAAEVLARGKGWDVSSLQEAKANELRAAGLEVWTPVPRAQIGGLTPFFEFVDTELIPFARDPQLPANRILCAGVPGVGKTYGTRAVAEALNCQVVYSSPERCKAGIVGASGANFRRQLATINAMSKDAPLIVVFDEIDKLATEGLDGGASSGIYGELLTWLDGGVSTNAIVFATLNRLQKIDAALESRFAVQFFYDLPNRKERVAVSRIHLTRLGCSKDTESVAVAVAEETEGFSSRELAQKVIPSILRMTNRKPTPTAIADICKKFTPTSKTQTEQLKAMRDMAKTLRPANDADEGDTTPKRRHIAKDDDQGEQIRPRTNPMHN